MAANALQPAMPPSAGQFFSGLGLVCQQAHPSSGTGRPLFHILLVSSSSPLHSLLSSSPRAPLLASSPLLSVPTARRFLQAVAWLRCVISRQHLLWQDLLGNRRARDPSSCNNNPILSVSSAGRAPALHAGGRGFKPHTGNKQHAQQHS
jgi:hypothetical protein